MQLKFYPHENYSVPVHREYIIMTKAAGEKNTEKK